MFDEGDTLIRCLWMDVHKIKTLGQCCPSKDAGVEVLTDVMHLSPMTSLCVCVCACVCCE